MAGRGRRTAENCCPPLPGRRNTQKKLKQQSTGARRRVGSAGGLQGLTEVTPLALLFVLAGRQRRVAFDGQNALRSIKTLRKQLINNQLLEGDVGEQQVIPSILIEKNSKID